MLIKIINCNPANYLTDLNRRLALTNILTSHGVRKNIVIAAKGIMTSVQECGFFGATENAFSQDVMDNLREHMQLVDVLDFYVCIDFENGGINCATLNNKTVVTIGYSYFTDSENVQALSLITEGSNDFNFYKLVANYYSKHISPLKLNLTLVEKPGSGSQSKSVFDRLSRSNKLLLCIVDNDKKHPNKGEGGTSGIFTHQDRSTDSVPLVKVLEVREIESLIPIKVIEDWIGIDTDARINLFDEFKVLDDFSDNFRTYFDHKHGLTLKEAIELDNIHGAFWLDILGEIDDFSSKDCFNDKLCSNCNSCPKILGFGEGLLDGTVSELNKLNMASLKYIIEPNLLSYWMDIGKLLMSWGCSGTGRAVRG